MSSISKNSKLRIIPLGGLGEIGMNCMVLEYEDEIIVVDCGIMFSDLDHFGVQFQIPDFSYLIERKDKIKAFIMTHGHEDHIGSLSFALKAGLKAPVYASNFTTLMIKERFKEYSTIDLDVRAFKMGEVINLGKFKITTVSVNHSIVDSAALIIETPVGKIIHTGDFKIDATPFIGKMIDLHAFGKAGESGVLLLMSDSTNVERHEHSVSENVVYQAFERLFAAAEGMTVVSMFSSNVARMGQIFELAQKMGKRVALAGRSVETNVQLGAETGHLHDVDKVLINLDQIDDYDRHEVIVISTGSQGEYRSALIRAANGEHPFLKLEERDQVLMSSRFIPGNERAIGRMINNLFKQGATVFYEAVHDIHVSGHATRPELKRMLELIKPKYFLPIHGEYRHLVHHAEVARETGIPDSNIKIAVNNDVLEISADSFAVVDQLDDSKILLEGREGHDITKTVLKDRRQMGEKGIVFALLVRNVETRRIISGPEIIARGLASDQMENWLIEESRELTRKIIVDYEDDVRNGEPEIDLGEEIRVELRRFYNGNIGKKPVVVPVILEL